MFRPFVLILFIAFADCLAHTPGKQVGEWPAGWNMGAELSTFEQGRTHAGGAQDRLYHNSTDPVDTPASCTAFRGGEAFSEDTCVVIREPRSVFGHTFGPWHLFATWKAGDNDADRNRGDSVVAFDASGKAVAFWDGKMDPNGSFATE